MPNQCPHPRATCVRTGFRPRVTRVKTGCLVCRLRRKKCDERKPTCTGCERNKLICSWASSKSGETHPSPLGWRSRLLSGDPVSVGVEDLQQTPARSPVEPNAKQLYPPLKCLTTPQEPISMEAVSLSFGLCLPELFSTASLKDPTSRLLFEHYVNKTSHQLSAIRGPGNPFITCVLPLALADSTIMNSVLAVSGAHLCATTSQSVINLAFSTHYALVVRQFKHNLTQLASGNVLNGKSLKPVNLLLTALMLCQVEGVSGNSQGAVFHHLRASSYFVRQLLSSNFDEVGHELSGFLLELYTYLVAVVNITANTNSDYHSVIFDPYAETLGTFRDSKMYGSMLGCAQPLFEMIPSICKLGYRVIQDQKNDTYSGEHFAENMTAYKLLEARILGWQPQENTPEKDEFTSDRVIAAKIYQQSLLIFLHSNYYGSQVSDPTFLNLIDKLLEVIILLVMLLPLDSPILTTFMWPTMIIGSCIREPLGRGLLLGRIRDSPFNMTSISKGIQLLEWLWEDDDPAAFGPYGLGLVMKKHNVTYCMC